MLKDPLPRSFKSSLAVEAPKLDDLHWIYKFHPSLSLRGTRPYLRAKSVFSAALV